LDIGGLTGLVSAAEQDDDGFPVLAVAYAIASADMDAQFTDTRADGLYITKVACLRLPQANPDAGLGHPVAQGIQPFRKRLAAVIVLVSEQFYH
jgi:hypothetical protein